MNTELPQNDNVCHQPNNNIEKEEVLFWEKAFAAQLEKEYRLLTISDDRLYPREKFLISKIRPLINSKTKILEIGGGNFGTIKTLLDPDEYNYFYVGSDIVMNALKIGQERIKTGEFVQCNVEVLPFSPESFDIILSFGVLHHTPSLENNIPKLFNFLKKNGLLVLHDPIYSRNRDNLPFIKLIREYIYSKKKIAPMQRKLKESNLFYHLQKEGQIILAKKEYSLIRYILVKSLRKLIPKCLTLLKIILLLDDITIQLSKLLEISIMNYGGIMILAKKIK